MNITSPVLPVSKSQCVNTPGVPAFAAAAAALECELTVPEVAQSVVLTRVSGRASRMPETERLATFAKTGATLVVHLAIHAVATIADELTPFYGADCPVAVVVRASWPDERVLRGTLGDICASVAAAPIERILARVPGADGIAVYAVPDSRTGDQVMAATDMLAGTTFDPDAFAHFLTEQRDLGTKWAPRYVRIVDARPVGATDKIDKRPLRAERWDTPDPLFWRAPRAATYERFTADDAAELAAEFRDNGRANLLR